ncbi:hypothetical protein CP8484711_2011, partial [Chlamydia psittaci 84-8471/1]
MKIKSGATDKNRDFISR